MSEQSPTRVMRNIVHGFSTWVLPLFLGLIVTRVVVRSLGHTDYGIYALVLGFIAYSFNFSIGRAITKYLAEYRAAGEIEKIRGIISATAVLTVTIAVAGSIVILTLSGWLVRNVFEIEADLQAKSITALNLSAAIIFVFMIGQVATAVMQGLHRFDIFSRIQNTNSLVMMVGNLIIAWMGYGLLALLYWNLAVVAFICVLSFVMARRLLPEFGFGLDLNGDPIRLVLKYSAGVVGYQIVANAFFLFERSWVIARLGAEALTFYVVPMTVGIYMHGFILSLSMVLFPLASELDRDRDRLLRLYRYATKAVFFVVVILAASLIAEGELFLTLWMGPEFGVRSATLLAIHTIAFGLAAIVIVSFQTAEALGRPSFNFRNMAVGVAIAVPLMIALTAPLSGLGIALGRVVVFVVSAAAIGLLERRHFGRVQTGFWLGNIVRLILAGLAAAIVERILVTYLPASWLTLVTATFAGCFIYAAVLFISRFADENDRRMIRKILGRSA